MTEAALDGDIRRGKWSLVDKASECGVCQSRWLSTLVHTFCEKKVASLEKAESPVIFCDYVEISDGLNIINGFLKGLIGFCRGVSNSEIAIHLVLLGYVTMHAHKDYIEKIIIY